jgi:hypothetical protein
MSRLDDAKERLDTALRRLEYAVDQRVSQPRSDPAKDRLERDLAGVRNENERLKAESRRTARRLEASIERLQAVLSNGDGNG